MGRGRGALRVTFDSVGVIGGGAWGTALAQTLRLAGRQVRLWAREAEVAAEINAQPHQRGVPAGRRRSIPARGHDRARRHRRAGRGADGGARPSTCGASPARSPGICPRASPSSCAPRAWSRRRASCWARCSPRRSRTPPRPCCRGRASPPTWRAACPRHSRSPSPTRRSGRRWRPRSAPAPCASTGRATRSACSWAAR